MWKSESEIKSELLSFIAPEPNDFFIKYLIFKGKQ